MLPLGAYLILQSSNPIDNTDNVFDGKNSIGQFTGLDGLPMNSESFVEASENSLNSVVHVTTKVVTTNFQRDLFSEFFYGPGAGGKEF